MDGLEQDMFHGQGGAVADIELAAALGVADMDPGGGSTEGAVKTSRVPEGIRECGMPPAAVVPARNSPHSRQCCCRPMSGPDGSVATDSHRQSPPAIALHTISRFQTGLAALAIVPTAGGGQRSLAAIPRSV